MTIMYLSEANSLVISGSIELVCIVVSYKSYYNFFKLTA